MRRCGVCGRFASVVILTIHGPLAWHHRHCARQYGMAAVPMTILGVKLGWFDILEGVCLAAALFAVIAVAILDLSR